MFQRPKIIIKKKSNQLKRKSIKFNLHFIVFDSGFGSENKTEIFQTIINK